MNKNKPPCVNCITLSICKAYVTEKCLENVTGILPHTSNYEIKKDFHLLLDLIVKCSILKSYCVIDERCAAYNFKNINLARRYLEFGDE